MVRYPGGKYDCFPAVYVPNFLKTRQRRNNTEPGEAKPLPLVEQYDGNLHDLIANLRRIDGSLPPHVKYGPPVSPREYIRCWTQILGQSVIACLWVFDCFYFSNDMS